MQRTPAQNRKFSALVGEVAAARMIGPWKKAIAREAWKRWFLARYCREARIEAYANGWPDPFPELTARSSELSVEQMQDLIECTFAYAAQQLGLVLD
jgi:hypothetical protein